MSTTDDPVEHARRELRRCVDRVVALGPDRLVRSGPRHVGAEVLRPDPGDVGRGPAGSTPAVAAVPADAVRATLQALADRAADLDGRPRRDVPRLRPHALADQLVVLTGEALAAAHDRPHAVAAVHDDLVGLRRAL